MLRTWTVLELTGIRPRHPVNVVGSMDLGLVDGGSVLREASPTTTSPETSSVAVSERRAFFHQVSIFGAIRTTADEKRNRAQRVVS